MFGLGYLAKKYNWWGRLVWGRLVCMKTMDRRPETSYTLGPNPRTLGVTKTVWHGLAQLWGAVGASGGALDGP